MPHLGKHKHQIKKHIGYRFLKQYATPAPCFPVYTVCTFIVSYGHSFKFCCHLSWGFWLWTLSNHPALRFSETWFHLNTIIIQFLFSYNIRVSHYLLFQEWACHSKIFYHLTNCSFTQPCWCGILTKLSTLYFHDTCLIKVLQMNTLCSTEKISWMQGQPAHYDL